MARRAAALLRSARSLSFLTVACTYATLGCGGMSKKEAATTESGDQVLVYTIQMDGSLIGYDFWEGGFDVFAVGEDAAGSVVKLSDGTERSPVAIKPAMKEDSDVPIGLLTFALPAAATHWRLEVDSIVGRECTFTPSEGSAAEIPTEANASLALLDGSFTITSACTTAYKVSGTVDMEVEDLVVKMNDESFTVDATGSPAAFTFTTKGDRTYADVTDGGTVIKGNGRAFWSNVANSVKASSPKIADYTLTATQADGTPCVVDPAANRFEETVSLSANNGEAQPPYVKIFNRLNAVKITCKLEPTLTLAGTVTGLEGTLVLETAAGDSLTVTTEEQGDEDFEFEDKVFAGMEYTVSIKTQPDHQTCEITKSATGTPSKSVGDITIACAYKTYSLGGAVSGQTGEFTVAVGDQTVTVAADATTYLVEGLTALDAYTAVVTVQPEGQTCTIAATGTTTSLTADVADADITCVDNASFRLGSNVTGVVGAGMKIRNNITLETLDVGADGFYEFLNVGNGDDFDIRILVQPSGQTCTFVDEANAVGMLTSDRMDVDITCP